MQAMRRCSGCGRAVDSTARFCGECGQQVHVAFPQKVRGRRRFNLLLVAVALAGGGAALISLVQVLVAAHVLFRHDPSPKQTGPSGPRIVMQSGSSSASTGTYGDAASAIAAVQNVQIRVGVTLIETMRVINGDDLIHKGWSAKKDGTTWVVHFDVRYEFPGSSGDAVWIYEPLTGQVTPANADAKALMGLLNTGTSLTVP